MIVIRGVLFDLDGTLHDRQASVVSLARDQHSRFVELQGLVVFDYVDLFMRLDNRGYTPKPEVYANLASEIGLEEGVAHQLERDYFATYTTFAVGFPGLKPMLQTLADAGLKLGLITNGGEQMQRDKVDALGIANYFSSILISEAVGLRKPDPAIFHRCLQELGISANEAVMVGDHPDLDVAAAQRVGMKSVWLVDSHWGACDHADSAIDDLASLPAIIQALSLGPTALA